MAAVSQVSVKVYWEKPGVTKPEIRRFAVDQGVSTNFSYFSAKVVQVFPGLAGKKHNLYWKDEENDYIAFSSDDELVEALGSMQDDVFRVYVKEEQGQDEEGILHPRVICDECDGPVCGSRFKCTVCPDYDLCSKCEQKGMHSQHQMIRIRTPGSRWGNFWAHPPFGHPPPHGHPPPPPHHHGPPPPPPPHHHGPPPPPPPHHGPPPPPPPHDPRWMPGVPNVCRWWRRLMRQDWQQGQGQARAEQAQQQAPPNGGAGAEPSGMPQPNVAQTHEDYLKAVGETVAAMLDPLGIDVAVDVECNGTRQRCGQPEPAPAATPRPAESATEADRTAPAKETEAVAETEDTEMQEANAETGEKPIPSTTAAQDAAMETADSHSQGADSSDGEWTIVTPERTESSPAKVPAETQMSVSQPQSGHSVHTPMDETDKKIQEALEQMKEMGFSDDDGWLSRLLVAKDGSIVAVLDAIQTGQ